MPQPLPLDERLDRAGQLEVRSRIFLDIWFYFEGKDTRPNILDTMNEFSEFFRFAPHAHFVSFVVTIAALFEKRTDTINLPQLTKEMQALQVLAASAAAELPTCCLSGRSPSRAR